MRPSARLALTCLLSGLLIVACRQFMPTNRYLQKRAAPSRSTADARGKFDHNRHAKTLQAAHVTCLDCHRFDLQIEADDPQLAKELSARALQPGSAACHFCHGPGETAIDNAPHACSTCHENMTALRPANHDLSWDRVHAQLARTNPAQCETCHRQAECIDCHQRRDTVRTRVHERNFRFFHGIEATANPMECSSCHRQNFCISCHQNGQTY